MKKFFLIGLIILLLIACALIYYFHHYEAVPIMDGLHFGDGANLVRWKLGAPERTEESQVSPETVWQYSMQYAGLPATLHLTFNNSALKWYLKDVCIIVCAASEQEANSIKEQAIADIQANFGAEEHYYETLNDDSAELGLNYGATGISCRVQLEGCTVRILCLNSR